MDTRRDMPTAKNGVLDLRDWDFERDGNVLLDGDWQFYWQETKDGVQFSEDLQQSLPKVFLPVPGAWKGQMYQGKPLPGFGYATYKLKVLLPPKLPQLAVHNLDLSSSYRFWLDGKLLHEEGRFSPEPAQAEPSYKPYTGDLPKLGEQAEFIVEISNFHYSKGGFWESSEIGEQSQISAKLNKKYQIISFVAGSIFLWALYHLGLYLMRREDKPSLLISLFSFFLVLRLLTTGERFLTAILPNISMDLLIRLEFSTAYIATGVFAYFYHLVFPMSMGKRSTYFFIFTLTPFIASLVGDVASFSSLALYYQVLLITICLRTMIAIFQAFPYSKTKSVLSLIGFLFIFTTVLNDTFYQNNIINTMNLIPFGFLGFILFQGYILSYDFTRAYRDIEGLKSNLEISNQQLNSLKGGLEDLIVERTKELESSRSKIEQLNEFARTINSTIRLEAILEKAHHYLRAEIDSSTLLLFLVDPIQKRFVLQKAVLDSDSNESMLEKIQSVPLPLDDRAGILFSVYQRKRPFVFKRVKEAQFFDSNERILSIVGKKPGILLPLLSQGRVIALLAIFKHEEKDIFSNENLEITKSIAEAIATSVGNSILIENLNRERNFAEITKIQMEDAKNEISILNDFTKTINTKSDLSHVIEEMFDYIEKNFKIAGVLLQLVDETKKELYSYKIKEPRDVSEEQIKFAKELRLVLNKESGIVYRIFQKQRAYLVSTKRGKPTSRLERDVYRVFPNNPFFIVPLVVQNQVIGMVYFTSFQKENKLQSDLQKRIVGFCDQIAGAVLNSILLQSANLAKRKSDRAKAEIQKLNEFAKRINSLTHLEGILAEIFGFIKQNYEIENCVLFYLDQNDSQFRYLNHSGFTLIDDSTVEFFKQLTFPLEKEGGFVYQCYLRKKYFYMRHVPKSIPFAIDKEVIERSKTKSLLISPLINNDAVVAMAIFGIMDENKVLNKEEIDSIIGVSEHIASAINNSFLLNKIEEERKRSESLLLNILPKNVANELHEKGKVNPVEYENVSMLITGFPGFSQMTGVLTPEELIEGLDLYFSRFDEVIYKYNLEKLKMTGDMFVAAGGLPVGNFTHPIDVCLAALSIREAVEELIKNNTEISFQPSGVMIAIHTGPVVAGVIGKSKFSYDVWGKTVTQTQAIRRAASIPRIHVSEATMEKAKSFFRFEELSEIITYEGETIRVYELISLKDELVDPSTSLPNEQFDKFYTQQKRGARILSK